MKCENIGLNSDLTEGLLNCQLFRSVGEQTENMCHVMTSNSTTLTIDQFQRGVKNTLRAVQFAKFEAEE
jgi:hypothetical protein